MIDPLAQFEVLFDVRGHSGVIKLSRPQALNALTHGMIQAIRTQMDAWEADPAIVQIVFRSLHPKAFCAGGDIRAVYEMGKAGDETVTSFFADEYRLNTRIKHYPKPIVSLIDGILMGGGVGLTIHGDYRLGGAKTLFAMPEVGIGFFPDVGASYALPRLRSKALGLYCALTGGRLKQADALWAGVLTHCADAGQFDEILKTLAEEDVKTVVERFAAPAEGEAALAPHADAIESCFSADSVEAVLAALDAVSGVDEEWARATAAEIRTRSPMSLKVAFKEVQEGAAREFDDCMVMEFRILSEILKGNDFYEGVWAVLVDKDNAPNWTPSRLEDVESLAIERHFMQPQEGDLVLS
ncbi:enoyl-CoA hydratase/isomerase family protein [Breoghania sp.]|uniref:enoyl-CoA hydratase/isomerase family protein n=1 Tax=Breoghania sp. TaxID=2065378 RepID=UPI002634E797|nr:enoyl-CoA hydratase/isomerase family protein [Breoghania sp.]MDJ0932280.1 enoyl-CoA hydratase/isomerase family protein [Breoghania sp.]